MNKHTVERIKNLETNEELILDLMEHSPYGGLGQVFIVEAIRQYAEQIAAADPNVIGNGLISGEAWQGVAKDVKERCDLFYDEK